MSNLTSTQTDPWAVTLLVQISRLQFLQLGQRQPTISDYQALLTWAQELNGWVMVVG